MLNHKFSLSTLISQGAFGKVYDVLDNDKKTNYVAKIVNVPSNAGSKKSQKNKNLTLIANSLFYEYTLINGHLRDFPYRPSVPANFYGETARSSEKENIRYLIMEKLDITLKDYIDGKNSRVYYSYKYGKDILSGLKWLHERSILYIDIKPENFMLKKNGEGYKLYFIDFGVVRLISHSIANNDAGTPQFQSINVNKGGRYLIKDELISLTYMLIYLCSIEELNLPWSNSTKKEQMIRLKESENMEELCHDRDCYELYQIYDYLNNRFNTNDINDNYKYIGEKLEI